MNNEKDSKTLGVSHGGKQLPGRGAGGQYISCVGRGSRYPLVVTISSEVTVDASGREALIGDGGAGCRVQTKSNLSRCLPWDISPDVRKDGNS